MREIIKGKRIEPCYGAGNGRWVNYVNGLAIEAEDVSLIPGIGGSKRHAIVEAGFRTVNDVAMAQEKSLTEVQGIGSTTARKLITSAKAIKGGSPVPRSKTIEIPKAATEVFLDFEGTDPRIGMEGLEVVNYLIGAILREPSREVSFVPFFASSFEEEERTLIDFLKWGASLDDPIFCHWHHYERTHLDKMAGYYQIDKSLVSSVVDRLVDLHPIANSAFAFPAYGQGLKDIARCLGFTWRQDNVDALTSVVLYLKFIASEGTDEESKQQILDYNEDDCLATMRWTPKFGQVAKRESRS